MTKRSKKSAVSGDGVAAVNRAISLLAALEATAKPLTLADLARATGLYKSTILRLLVSLEHVLPNIASVIIVQAPIQFANAILAEAALSYLGLGTQPPQPSWGFAL